MLDFSFSPDQEEYRKALRELSLGELLPRYQEGDAGPVYPAEQIRRVIQFGEQFWKGRETRPDLVTIGITAEEVGRGDFNAVLPSLGAYYQTQFLHDLSPAQKERWLPSLLSGDEMIALCITEPAAGSDMAKLDALAPRARRDGEGWVIDGVKNSVSYLDAGVFYVFVRTDGEDGSPPAKGWQGISAFLVPRDTPGLSFEPFDDLGCRAIPRGILRLEGVRVGDEDRVGDLGTAFIRISKFFDVNRAVIALKCIGAAFQSIDETLAYMKQRVVFGSPLTGHQGAIFPLAEHTTHLEMARLMAYRTLWLRDHGHPCQREGAMVKWFGPKASAEAIHKCLLLHGHKGYSKELPLQQRLRDVIGWQIGDGSEEVMKLILTRELAAHGASADAAFAEAGALIR